MNPLILKQIKKYLGENYQEDEKLKAFISAVNDSYDRFMRDQKLLQRSLDISSAELKEKNKSLLEESQMHSMLIDKIRTAVVVLDENEQETFKDVKTPEEIFRLAYLFTNLIQEKKKTEIDLKKAKDYAELLFKLTPIPIFTVDVDRNITSWNQKIAQITGYSEKEIIGKKCTAFTEYPCANACNLFDSKLQKPLLQKECLIRCKNGDMRVVVKNSDLLHDESGRIIGGIESFEDITERKKAEEQLRLSIEEWEATFNSMPDLISIHDKNFNLMRANKSFLDEFKVDLKGIVGKKCYELFHESYCADEHCPQIQAKKTREISEAEIFEPSLNKYFRVVAAPIFNVKDGFEGCVHIATDITEKKNGEQKILDAYERFNRVMDGFDSLVYVADLGNHQILYINKYGKDKYGDVLGLEYFNVLDFDKPPFSDDPIFEEIFAAERRPMNFEAKLISPEGIPSGVYVREVHDKKNDKWYECRDQAIVWTDGKMVRLEIAIDITGRKKSEEMLYQQNEALEQSLAGITIEYVDGEIVYANKAWAHMHGIDVDQIYGKFQSDFHSMEQYEQQLIPFDKILFERNNHIADIGHKKTDGSLFDVWMAATLLRDRNNQPKSIIRTAIDLTELREAQRKIIDSEQRFKLIAERSYDIIFELNSDGRFCYCSPSVERILGFTNDDIIGQPYDAFFCKEDSARMQAYFLKVISGDPAENQIIRLLTKDKKNTVIFETNAMPVFVDGNLTAVHATARDITERKKVEDELAKYRKHLEDLVEQRTRALLDAKKEAEKASHAKSEFLANMSHEIRTPMNAILGYAQMLQQTELNDKQKKFINTIFSSGELLITIINDVLDVAKIESGKIELELIEFNLEYLINDVIDIAVSKAKSTSVQVKMHMSPGMPRQVKGDPTRLRQIVLNLLSNAFKFTEEGRIDVIVGWREGEFRPGVHKFDISVKDTGIGIPEDKKEVIFESFMQADISTTRKYGGTGLGLTICKRLVEAMGGVIKVESIVGKGSLFSFSVVLETPHSNGSDRTELLTVEDLKGCDAIVLMKNDNDRDEILRILARIGLNLVFVSDLADYKAAYKAMVENSELNPDVIIAEATTDLASNIQFVNQIKSNPNFSKARLLAVSEGRQVGIAHNAQASGFNGFLSVPFEEKDLVNLLRSILSDRRSKKSIITKHTLKEMQFSKIRILLIDDNQLNVDLIADYFKDFDVEFFSVNSGEDGIKFLKFEKVDICLLDIQMPGMDGFSTAKYIRSKISVELPIFALSAAVFEQDRKDARESGMNEFIPKPVNFDDLLLKIKKYVSLK